MVQPYQTSIAEHPESALYPSLQNPAIALCTEIWQKVHAGTMKTTQNVYTADRCASKAFRLAMPPLSGYQNICDFIACAGYGMLLGAIKVNRGHDTYSRLFSAFIMVIGTLSLYAPSQLANC
jgi:hypothetical protein